MAFARSDVASDVGRGISRDVRATLLDESLGVHHRRGLRCAVLRPFQRLHHGRQRGLGLELLGFGFQLMLQYVDKVI